MRQTILLLTLLLVAGAKAQTRGTIEADYLSASDMNDREGQNHGSGDMLRVKGRCTLPLRLKLNERRQPTAWALTLAASYARLDNKGEAATLNPKEIVNASLNVSYTAPLSERWQLLASLGAGVYAQPDDIGWRSLLANGAAIFAYRFSDNLSAGLGLGLTNSYGAPMVLPMGYLDWRTSGNIKVTVSMASGLVAKASTMFGKTFGLELTAIDMDGMSAVTRQKETTRIFSTMMMRSSLIPMLRLGRKTTLRLNLGAVWLRTARTTDRSLKSFFKSFGDDEGKYRFKPSLRLGLSLSYGI